MAMIYNPDDPSCNSIGRLSLWLRARHYCTRSCVMSDANNARRALARTLLIARKGIKYFHSDLRKENIYTRGDSTCARRVRQISRFHYSTFLSGSSMAIVSHGRKKKGQIRRRSTCKSKLTRNARAYVQARARASACTLVFRNLGGTRRIPNLNGGCCITFVGPSSVDNPDKTARAK